MSADVIQDWMPIQDPPYHRSTLRVPMDMLDRERCLRNHDQTPERLRQRGGLGPVEALWILDGVRYGSREYDDPMGLLRARVEAYLNTLKDC